MLSAAAKAHKIANGVPDEEKENQEKQKRTSAMLKAMKAQADAKKKPAPPVNQVAPTQTFTPNPQPPIC
jgi:hypothetical protein